MKNSRFIMKASQQILNEILGFDEGRTYYFLLLREDKKIDEEYSYSKKYRILKSLFERGGIAKFKEKNSDLFKYLLLPPSFLHFHEIDGEIIDFLEKIYLDNHSLIFDSGPLQIMLKDERPLIVFLLKHFMKNNANLVAHNLNISDLLGDRNKKINMTNCEEQDKRTGVIDRHLVFEFAHIPKLSGMEYMGYVSKNFPLKV